MQEEGIAADSILGINGNVTLSIDTDSPDSNTASCDSASTDDKIAVSYRKITIDRTDDAEKIQNDNFNVKSNVNDDLAVPNISSQAVSAKQGLVPGVDNIFKSENKDRNSPDCLPETKEGNAPKLIDNGENENKKTVTLNTPVSLKNIDSNDTVPLNSQTSMEAGQNQTEKRKENDEKAMPVKESIALMSSRIILIGKTGTGKSATGNTILGQSKFHTDSGFTSCTSSCQKEMCVINDQRIEIIDTPGLYDTSKTEEMVKRELSKCMEMSLPGPHVFLVILSVERITEQEKYTLKYMADIFGGQDFLDHTIIVITRKENFNTELDSDEEDEDWDVSNVFEDFIRASEDLDRMVTQCSGRCVAISNASHIEGPARRREGQRLLHTINQLIEKNKRVYYSNDLFEELERKRETMRKEEERKRQNAIKEMERQRVERKKEMERRERNIEKLQKNIVEEEEKLKRDKARSEDDILELREKLREMASENEDMEQRLKEREKKMKKEIEEMREKNYELNWEIDNMKRRASQSKGSESETSRCKIM